MRVPTVHEKAATMDSCSICVAQKTPRETDATVWLAAPIKDPCAEVPGTLDGNSQQVHARSSGMNCLLFWRVAPLSDWFPDSFVLNDPQNFYGLGLGCTLLTQVPLRIFA